MERVERNAGWMTRGVAGRWMLRPAIVGLCCVFGLVGCGVQPKRVVEAPGVVELVREHFYDSAQASRWAQEHAALDGRDTVAVAAALAELNSSHTELIPLGDPRHAAMRAIFGPDRERVTESSIGIDAVRIGPSWFIRRVFAGGPAAAAGLLRGDEIVAANGEPFGPVASLAGRGSVALTIRRLPGDPVFTRTVLVEEKPVLAAWLQAQCEGTRIEVVAGTRVGIIPLFSGAGEAFREEIESAIRGPLRSAEALVIDLRDGYGGCSPEYVRPFLSGVPVLRSRDRAGHESVYDAQWRGPLVLLVNGGSRSGKEIIARSLQRQGRALVVGERTAGAVLAGQLFRLADGGLLYLAVQDVEIDGERLEGVGVIPDVPIADRLSYAVGRDPQLDEACARAAAAVR